jgi:predicted metal-binding protein
MDLSQPSGWHARALELGVDKAVVVDSSTIVTADWVRMKCLYGCDDNGSYRTCPPNSPAPDFTQRLVDGYSRALLLQAGPINGRENSDPRSRQLNDAAYKLEGELFLAGYHKAWMMGAGPCDVCGTCDLEAPSARPERARPSMEGCGVDVFTTVRNAGWTIDVVRDEDDVYRFFALVLVD